MSICVDVDFDWLIEYYFSYIDEENKTINHTKKRRHCTVMGPYAVTNWK